MKNRVERLDSEFRKLIYEICKTKVHGVTEMFSITEVVTTPDLKHAKVYLSVFSSNEDLKKKTFDSICHASPFIRSELGKMMHIRLVPELSFVEDGTFEYGNKIDKLLNQISNDTKVEENNK